MSTGKLACVLLQCCILHRDFAISECAPAIPSVSGLDPEPESAETPSHSAHQLEPATPGIIRRVDFGKFLILHSMLSKHYVCGIDNWPGKHTHFGEY